MYPTRPARLHLMRFDSPRAPDGWSIAFAAGRRSICTIRFRMTAILRARSRRVVDGEAPTPITISVRLDHATIDHVYRRFVCAPGPCCLQLPFAELFDRSVARVNAVVIFTEHEQAGLMFYLGRVALRE